MTLAVPGIPRARYTRLTSQDRRAALIEAALTCIAEGGIRAFTVDRICARAQVSRGLITHHFGTMSALLTAVYAHIYTASLPPGTNTTILLLLDHFFAPAVFNRPALNIWLTLWSEISNTPDLGAEHRAQYRRYHAFIVATLTRSTPRPIDAAALATSLICLVDGLGLQHCIDPDTMPATRARQACLDLLTPHTGPLT